jgi:asparagine synthase (glutamine-hydrolysing)
MDGIFGWLGNHPSPQALLQTMSGAARSTAASALLNHAAPGLGAGGASRFGKASLQAGDGCVALIHGRPRFVDEELAAIAREHSPAAAVAQGWARLDTKLPTVIEGSFALAVLQPMQQRAFLALDRIGIERLCFGERIGTFAFGASVQSVCAHPAFRRNIDPQSIYDYLFFHMIPCPGTIYRGIHKLLPGECLVFENGAVHRSFYWHADYRPVPGKDFAAYRTEFRSLLSQSVKATDGGSSTAAFLSGGTDSSTVVGSLTAVRKGTVDTFSIGFDAQGFDEMEYARCAAERFKSRMREYYLKPEDIVTAIPIIASEYDEPFGNDSGVPTFFCAQAAKDSGFESMLAGDGGDEIFGGNERYAKQRIFEWYFRLPSLLRHGLIGPASHLPLLSDHLPLRKLRSYVDQANVRLPMRLETYNFLRRSPLKDILEPEFIRAISPRHADDALSEVYSRTNSEHFINGLLHVDLKFTLADSDLRKVSTMTEAAGIEARYPLLDDRLVAFANRLPVNYKVRGTRLRWFFKEALRDLLPEKIINKKKHGFGLPFGMWSEQHEPLREVVSDSLADLGKRGWVKPAYLDHILKLQREEHATYYGKMIWVTMMLEQWLQANGH